MKGDWWESKGVKKVFQKHRFKTGFLKLAILRLLAERPMHGYEIMKEIERITESDWRPSPGSIYPALKELMDYGMISQTVEGRRRIYTITDEGKETLGNVLLHAKSVLGFLHRLFPQS